MRTAFINTLTQFSSDNTFLVTGDLGFSVIEKFQERNPERYLNAGIAEQNMAGLAAGLAMEGFKVFIYSIANFNTFRCLEQIRNDICYNNIDVTIVSVGGGFVYGSAGYSHHAVQDICILGSLPNMTLLLPNDSNETIKCVQYALSNPGPKYLRIGRNGEKVMTSLENDPLSYNVVRRSDKSKTAIAATGGMLSVALEAAEMLSKDGIDVDVYSFPLLGIDFSSQICKTLGLYSNIFTLEEHILEFGFGSLVRAAFSGRDVNLKNFGIDRGKCNVVGSQNFLRKVHGIDAESVAKKIRSEVL